MKIADQAPPHEIGTDPRKVLLPAQAWVWELSRIQPSSAGLWLPLSIRLEGRLNPAALREAFHDTLRRHAVLRTVFEETGGKINKRVLTERPGMDLVNTTAGTATSDLQSFFAEPFDLNALPPVSARLLVLSEDSHILAIRANHLTLDAWSIRPLVLDLFGAYESRCAGTPRNAEDPSDGNFSSEYGRASSRHELLTKKLDFWPQVLHGLADNPAPVQSPVDMVDLRIREELHRQCLLFASARGMSLFMLLHAALVAAFARLGLGRDVTIAATVPGRGANVPDSLLGRFSNIIPLRTVVTNPSFAELLEHIRGVNLDAFASQIPYRRILDLLPAGHALKRNPTPQFFMGLRSDRYFGVELPGLTALVRGGASFPFVGNLGVEFTAIRSPQGAPLGIHGTIDYKTAVFHRRVARDVSHELWHVLKDMIRRPDLPILSGEPAVVLDTRATRDSIEGTNVGRKRRGLSGPPRYSVEQLLAVIWENALKIAPLEMDANFFDLGGTLVQFQQMLDTMEERLGVGVPCSLALDNPTLHHLASQVLLRVDQTPLLEIHAGNPNERTPFFFLHGDLSGAGLYMKELSRYLDAAQPFFALQQHGLNGQDVPQTIEEMAEDQVGVLRRAGFQGPYRLGGYCNGALIAFEMARRLAANGASVESVVLIDPPCRWATVRGTVILPQPSPPPGNWRRNARTRGAVLYNQYSPSVGRYRPRHYPGDVALIHTEQHGEPIEPAAAWDSVAGRLTSRSVPETHLTILGRGLANLGAALSAVWQSRAACSDAGDPQSAGAT